MADICDITDERVQVSLDADIAAIQRAAAAIPKGEPGECEYCGEHFPRLVFGVCARCRDKYRLD